MPVQGSARSLLRLLSYDLDAGTELEEEDRGLRE